MAPDSRSATPSPGVTYEPAAGTLPRLRIDAVIPVYNEQHVLAGSVHTLQHPGEVVCLHLDQKGRGRALRYAWLHSDADILSYMDVDLSTDIAFYPELIQAIVNGYDVATGSRLMAGSRTNRSPKREFISRSYNLLTKVSHFTRIQDMQCGFKAISRRAAQELVPLVQNNEWFFDTELLLLAEKFGYRVKEFPVRWVEDPDTRVKIVKTAMEDIRGLARLRLLPSARPART